MDSNPNRDGWNHQSQGHGQAVSQSQTPSGPNGGPVLPNPPQSFFQSNPPPAHNLPGIAGLTQGSQSHPSATAQMGAPRSDAPPLHAHSAPQPPSHGFAAINQHQIQAQNDHERERAREMEEAARRDAEQRDREMRERQYREQQQAPPHEPQVIHQPVAVPPNVRSIHGPNGLLGNPGAASAPSAGQGPMATSQGLFQGAPLPDPQARPQQSSNQNPASLLPFVGQSGPQAAGGMNQAQQPILNDALSYLDQVKVQFADHPDVYNRFLDIMKDFKSGAIDTPGVIDRVSQLFAGNPGLIQGFNTFLPPGYKIECGTGEDPNTIRVTTPMGTTVSRMPGTRALSPLPAPATNGAMNPNYGGAGWPPQPGQEPRYSPDGRQNMAQPAFSQAAPTSHPALSPESYRDQQAAAAAIHRVEQQNVAQLQSAANVAQARDMGRIGMISSPGDANAPAHVNGVSPGPAAIMVNGGMEKRGPVEFNHAINYVNKIKNRFAQQPDIYKQFLEILQTYQRESKPIQDVYAQVTRLFETAPDLLEDFKQFLPESAASNQNKPPVRPGGEEAFPLSSTRSDPAYLAAAQSNNHLHSTPRPEQHRLPPMGNFAPTPSVNRDNKRKRGDRQGPPSSMTPIAAEASAARGGAPATQVTNGNKRLKQGQNIKPVAPVELRTEGVIPSLIPPPLPVPLSPGYSLTANTDDFGFFDKIRKQIGNKALWAEFMKLLNLYKNDMVDLQFLVFKAHAFIGANQDLMQQFKDFLNYRDSEIHVVNEPTNIHNRIQLSNCRGLGPSYRLLPKQETNKKCSGRDDLCNSVLNDYWVSHPTWASEDSGFVAHRKNVHEEGLHRVEEERHDYDSYIEACRRTIQLLEPLAQSLHNSPPEVRASYQLDPKLGGQSETIYRRVIFKIYGRDQGNTVLNAMFLRPYDVIPTLLARMKTHCEQWKAAQTQWERVWRIQTDQLFWKSLDHQGAATRVADKRQFFAKQLQNEIQVKYQEQKRQKELNRLVDVQDWHYKFVMEDRQTLRDAAGLVMLWTEQNFSTDHPTLARSIKELLTTFFILGPNELDQEYPHDDAMDLDQKSDGGASPRQRPANRAKGGLLRGVLDRGRRRDNDDSAASESRSRHSTPDEALNEMTDAEPPAAAVDGDSDAKDQRWFHHPSADNILNGKNLDPQEPYQRETYNMYGNAVIYCFMRLFGMLVERLEKIKVNEDNVREDVTRQKQHKAAHELGWIAKEPSEFFNNTSSTANYYLQMLDMFRSMIRADVEPAHVEETLRRYYLQDGWQLYSLDKLLAAINKFALGIFFPDAKEKTPDIYKEFVKYQNKHEFTTTYKEEKEYRRAVDRLAREGEIYRIGWEKSSSIMTNQLIKSGDPTFESALLSRPDNWKDYISSYETTYPTEGVDHASVRFPLLKRNLKAVDPSLSSDPDSANSDDKGKPHIQETMQFRINAVDYHMRVEPGTSDEILNYEAARKITKEDILKEEERRVNKLEEKYRANLEWMRGRGKEEVDQMKRTFQEKFEEVIETGLGGKRRGA